MLKLTAIACLALASACFAGDQGSFAPVTSTLTITDDSQAPEVVLPNGNKQTVSSWTTYKVTNAAIIAEAQRQGLISAGDISGWRLVAIADGSELAGFSITNGTHVVSIDSVIDIDVGERRGFVTRGKWTETSTGALANGSTTYLDGYVLVISINGTQYASTVAPAITDNVIRFNAGAVTVWKANPYKINVVGLPRTDQENRSVMRGALSIGIAKAAADLKVALPGFGGFSGGETDGELSD